MRVFLMNFIVASFKPPILLPKLLHLLDVLPAFIVPLICGILPTNLNGKAYIPYIVKLRTIWVSGHHSCSCKPIRHHRSQMINPITSCRITCNKDFVRIDNLI